METKIQAKLLFKLPIFTLKKCIDALLNSTLLNSSNKKSKQCLKLS